MIDNPPKPAREQYRRFRGKATKVRQSLTKLELVKPALPSKLGCNADFCGRKLIAQASADM